eukprot:3422049-Amphidinium_carterae.1
MNLLSSLHDYQMLTIALIIVLQVKLQGSPQSVLLLCIYQSYIFADVSLRCALGCASSASLAAHIAKDSIWVREPTF